MNFRLSRSGLKQVAFLKMIRSRRVSFRPPTTIAIFTSWGGTTTTVAVTKTSSSGLDHLHHRLKEKSALSMVLPHSCLMVSVLRGKSYTLLPKNSSLISLFMASTSRMINSFIGSS